MLKTRNVLLALISLILCSCSKSPFLNGAIMEETRYIEGNFTVLEVEDNVNVKLVHDLNPSDKIKTHIRANENLIDELSMDIHGDTLTIQNNNSFNWLRPYNCTLETTVYYDSIKKIVFNSNGILQSDILRGCSINDTVFEEDGSLTISQRTHLYLQIEGGGGDVNLLVNCDRMHTNYEWGTATVNLKGSTGIAYTSTSYNCHGPIDSQEMESNYHYIYSYGTNKVIVKAFHEVNAHNFNNGIVCYLRYQVTQPQIIWGHYDDNGAWIPPQTITITHSCPKHIVYEGEPSRLDSIVLN